MNNSNVLVLLPARVRQLLYVLYGLAALSASSTAVGYSSLNRDQPSWLIVAGAVIAFLAVPFSAIAATNVSHGPETPQGPVDEPAGL